MPNRLAFHESLDSTRATAAAPEDHPNLAQAQAEAVVSLLLGRSLSVNHTYAFDSRCFLDLADVVLETWSAAVRNATGAGRAELIRARPFVLHLFRQPTFSAACADQLRRSDRGSGNYFKLSAWQPIDQLPTVRHTLADVLEREDGGGAASRLPAEINENPLLSRYLDVLRRLNGYFSAHERSREAASPRVPLAAYVSRLVEMPETRLAELAAGHHCPQDVALRLRAAVAARATESQAAVAAVNRAWVHEATDLRERDPLLADQLRELVDTLYNAVLAESARAQFDYMSSVPRVDGRDELKRVNALAMALIDDTRQAPHDSGSNDAGGLAPRMAGTFTAAETVPDLPVAPLRTIFEAYWALVADDERRPSWQDSCGSLDRLLARRGPVDSRLRDAWESHLALLQTGLPHVVAIERGRLAVPAPVSAGAGAGDCAQTMSLGRTPESDLSLSFAAGEYLSDLARALGTSEDHVR